jgi:hypothetical protein
MGGNESASLTQAPHNPPPGRGWMLEGNPGKT